MSELTAEKYAPLLHEYLQAVVSAGGSDLHIRGGEPPFVRRNGRLMPIPEAPVLTNEQMAGLVLKLTERVPGRRAEFKEMGEADLSYELHGVARYRVNIFRERGNIAMTLRVIPENVPHIDEIGVPDVLKKVSLENHGLVLVTGATGSGKTTTLAAMIDYINRHRQAHILTIEDPIEIVHPNHASLISQREIGNDTGDFKQALRRALRQDPDVILIGEIRDEETMRTALAAAETGHLVMATLHTINAAETIARVLDLFPTDFEQQARSMLAGALKAVVSQRLARTVDDGRVAVVEIMLHTARIADCIANPEETGKLDEAIAAGEYYGMQTFDQALIKLIMQGRITEEEACEHVSSLQNFKLKLDSVRAQMGVEMRKAAEQEAARKAAEQHAAEQAAASAAAAAPRVAAPPAPAAPAAPTAPVAVPPPAAAPSAAVPPAAAAAQAAPPTAAASPPPPGAAAPPPPAPVVPGAASTTAPPAVAPPGGAAPPPPVSAPPPVAAPVAAPAATPVPTPVPPAAAQDAA